MSASRIGDPTSAGRAPGPSAVAAGAAKSLTQGVACVETVLPQGAVRVVHDGEPVLAAGSLTRFAVAVEADFDLPPGTEIGLARRWPSDWGIPQWRDAAKADYVQVTSGHRRAARWWNARLHAWHPFDHVLFVALPEGLAAGEALRVCFGGGDSPGFTAQTFIEETSPLDVQMRLASDQPWVALARFSVRIAGTLAHRLVLTAPSRVAAGGPFALHLRVEDQWGNPALLAQPVRIDGLDQVVAIPESGSTRIDATITAAGIHRLRAHVDGRPDLAATSNPIEVVEVERGALDHLLCWGDLHAQSVIGCGARTIDAYYRHARDFAATDFGSHQANCFLVSNPEWRETQASTAHTHADGRFVTLLGVEWSGATSAGGDHNLYFPGDEAPLHRCSHEFVADKSDVDTDLAHVTDVHEHYRGTDTLIAVHVGGRTADLRWHEPSLDRLLEVHSTHATSEWFLLDALRRGYRMGVIAGSDSVDGRPGASHPGHMGVRNVRGGLTAVAMPSLTRASLWAALKARHCYGTTGPRILLRVTAGDAQMGDEIAVARAPAFDVMAEGTAPLETIDFFRDDALLLAVDLLATASELSNRVRVGWNGASAPGNWQRARMQWDGELRVHGARIVAAEPWAFDTPDEGLREVADSYVRWRSITAGDWDGLVVELDDPADAEMTFVTEPMSLAAPLGDLGCEPRVFEAANPSRKVELRRLPKTMPPLGWRGRFEDAASPDGAHAYWVRVRQCDGELAWSTPIFVTIGSAQDGGSGSER